nr:hypothetical protein [Polaromonas naphthalenivorans]
MGADRQFPRLSGGQCCGLLFCLCLCLCFGCGHRLLCGLDLGLRDGDQGGDLAGRFGLAFLVVSGFLGRLAPALNRRGDGAKVDACVPVVNALGHKTAVVHPGAVACLRQGGVRHFREQRPALDHLIGAGLAVVQLAGLDGETFGCQLPCAAQNVRVVISTVAIFNGCIFALALVFFFMREMDRAIGGESVFSDQRLGEFMRQLLTLAGSQFGG